MAAGVDAAVRGLPDRLISKSEARRTTSPRRLRSSRLLPVPPAATVAEALKNSQAQVDKARK
jgi:hypothetical protein